MRVIGRDAAGRGDEIPSSLLFADVPGGWRMSR